MPFLALITTKDWVYGGLIVAILAGGMWYHHKLITEGVAEQKTADTIASDKLQAEAAKETADLQTKATMAEQSYEKEAAANADYRSIHPDQPVRLCISTITRGGIVSSIGSAHSGNESTGAAAANVPKVPDGNSSSGAGTAGPDIGGLLGLLAVKADDVSAELREFQSR